MFRLQSRENINCGVCTFAAAGVTSSACPAGAPAGSADTAPLTAGSSQTPFSAQFGLVTHFMPIQSVPVTQKAPLRGSCRVLLAVLLELQCHYTKIADETLAQANKTSFI